MTSIITLISPNATGNEPHFALSIRGHCLPMGHDQQKVIMKITPTTLKMHPQ